MTTTAFDWAGPARIVFGIGTSSRLPELVASWGPRVFLVTSAAGREQNLLHALHDAGFSVELAHLAGEPAIATVETAAARARAAKCDWVLGFGGGSAIDAAKAVAALLTNPGSALDYLEVIGRGQPLAQPAAPCAAIPTTAGTGAEATRNAVLHSPLHRVKASLRHASMLPRLALIDPGLALTLPAAHTASTGMDALTQLLEAFVCTRANPMSDALCARAIPSAARALPRAVADGSDLAARTDMALAALFSGLALANAGLGAVHGFAAPLGGRHGAPHGIVCAALLPAVWEVNLAAVRTRGSASILERFRLAATWLTGDEQATPEDGAAALRALASTLRIPSLSALGVRPADWSDLIVQAQRASSMKANPVPLTEEELRACLERA